MSALIGLFFVAAGLFVVIPLTIANFDRIREHRHSLLTAALILGGLAGAAYLGHVAAESALCGGVR